MEPRPRGEWSQGLHPCQRAPRNGANRERNVDFDDIRVQGPEYASTVTFRYDRIQSNSTNIFQNLSVSPVKKSFNNWGERLGGSSFQLLNRLTATLKILLQNKAYGIRNISHPLQMLRFWRTAPESLLSKSRADQREKRAPGLCRLNTTAAQSSPRPR